MPTPRARHTQRPGSQTDSRGRTPTWRRRPPARAGHTPPRGAAARLHNVTHPPPSTLPTVPREWTSSLDWPRSFIGESHDGHSSAQNPLKISPAPVVLPRLRMVFYAVDALAAYEASPASGPSSGATPRQPRRGLVKIDSRADWAARTLARPPCAVGHGYSREPPRTTSSSNT